MNSILFFLLSMAIQTFIYPSDEIILKARTDLDDVKSVRSMDCPKKLTDKVLDRILKKACNLESISAQGNSLQKPKHVSCAFLHTINFSNGTITKFPIGDWVIAIPHLKKLNLAHNKISSIASSTDTVTVVNGKRYTSWESSLLEYLDLSHNKLTELDLHIIDNATKLEHADFSHNKIAQIKTPKKLNHRNLCHLILYNNQLSQDHKNILQKLNILDTEQYEAAQRIGLYAGGITGTALGMIESATLLPYALKDDSGILVGICIGLACIIPCGTMSLGYSIATIIMLKKHTCTYNPLLLVFDEKPEKNDESANRFLEVEIEQ